MTGVQGQSAATGAVVGMVLGPMFGLDAAT